MKFKDFFQMNELAGQFSDVKQVQSLLGLHRAEKRLHTPVQKKSTTVGRAMAAGKVNSPSRPMVFISPTKSTTVASVLK